MYKMIIIDDEDIERECLASLIPWSDYGIEVADTAWNGIDGLEKIRTQRPEIVITDIKMPVMTGIELIKKARTEFPRIIFAVLSGHGDYEYTSQAMELGVRHYLLKPCHEEQITKMAEKIRRELDNARENEERRYTEQSRIRRLRPRAQAQLFSNMLQDQEKESVDYRMFLEEQEKKYPEIFLLRMKFPKNPDYLEYFALTNILEELLGEEEILLSTAMGQEVIYLLDYKNHENIQAATDKAREEYRKLFAMELEMAASKPGKLQNVSLLYQEANRKKGESPDIKRFLEADSRETVLFQTRFYLLKMKMEGKTLKEQKDKVCELLSDLSIALLNREKVERLGDSDALFGYLSETICESKGISMPPDKDTRRVSMVLQEFYRNIGNPDLSLQKLSREVLFMNEDYLGRLFYRQMKKRYSAYTVEQRIEMAKRLLEEVPDVQIAVAAEETGYPADGQYFSRSFKKVTGMTPSEYKDGRQKRML